jgi:hypothetical protein
MPAVNDVGKPCAGEPHARIDGRELETEHTTDHGDGEEPPAPSAAAASTTSRRACPQADRRQSPPSTGPRRPDQRLRTRGLKPLVTDNGRILEPDTPIACRTGP